MSITIFSRPVHSGKTTDLMRYCDEIAKTKIVAGILMPDIDGSRKLFNIETKEYFDIECKDPSITERSLTTVGNFNFYTDAFETGNTIIQQDASKSDILIIDEVGKLELEYKGFYQSIKELLERNDYKGTSKTLLIVVRDELYDRVVAFFDIAEHTLVNTLSDT